MPSVPGRAAALNPQRNCSQHACQGMIAYIPNDPADGLKLPNAIRNCDALCVPTVRQSPVHRSRPFRRTLWRLSGIGC